MDNIELYQGIDLTRAKILINLINDVLAGRFWIIEKNMICTGTQFLKNAKHEFFMLSQKNQSKCSTSFKRKM